MGQRDQPFPAAMEFGRRMRRQREAIGLTQEQLGERCDLHFTYIGSVERGERNVSLLNILKIAKALQVDAGDLIGSLKP